MFATDALIVPHGFAASSSFRFQDGGFDARTLRTLLGSGGCDATAIRTQNKQNLARNRHDSGFVVKLNYTAAEYCGTWCRLLRDFGR